MTINENSPTIVTFTQEQMKELAEKIQSGQTKITVTSLEGNTYEFLVAYRMDYDDDD